MSISTSVSDAELHEMQERAYRVRENNNASGSARALAGDVIRLTLLLQRARRGRGLERKRRKLVEDLNYLFELPWPGGEEE